MGLRQRRRSVQPRDFRSDPFGRDFACMGLGQSAVGVKEEGHGDAHRAIMALGRHGGVEQQVVEAEALTLKEGTYGVFALALIDEEEADIGMVALGLQ